MTAIATCNRDDWGTPVPLIEAARTVLGRIDSDPFSSHEAQKRVKATNYSTPEGTFWADGQLLCGNLGEADGFDSETWIGHNFVNPPGDPRGVNVTKAWEIALQVAEEPHHSVFWLGFNVVAGYRLQRRFGDRGEPGPFDLPWCQIYKGECVKDNGRVMWLNGDGEPGTSPGYACYASLLTTDERQVDRFRAVMGDFGNVYNC